MSEMICLAVMIRIVLKRISENISIYTITRHQQKYTITVHGDRGGWGELSGLESWHTPFYEKVCAWATLSYSNLTRTQPRAMMSEIGALLVVFTNWARRE